MQAPSGVTEIHAPLPREISGVAAVPGGYAVVGDEDTAGGRIWPQGGGFAFGPKLRGAESIDVGFSPSGDPLWLILGENRHRLVDLAGGRFTFPDRFRQLDGRGLEGVAVRPSAGGWEVAVCLEGGFFDADSERRGSWTRPLIAVLPWVPGEGSPGLSRTVELQVPRPSKKQRFRATDLVWDGAGWIVLLVSTNARRDKRKFFWLQRFDFEGTPRDRPIRLEELWGRYARAKNWEALDWSLDGMRFVLGHDAKKRKVRSALAVFTPRWP